MTRPANYKLMALIHAATQRPIGNGDLFGLTVQQIIAAIESDAQAKFPISFTADEYAYELTFNDVEQYTRHNSLAAEIVNRC